MINAMLLDIDHFLLHRNIEYLSIYKYDIFSMKKCISFDFQMIVFCGLLIQMTLWFGSFSSMTAESDNPLVLSVLHAASTAYSFKPNEAIKEVRQHLIKKDFTLKRSPGIIRKSRVSYPVPGFLSSATWPSLPKKHYNGFEI